MGEQDQAGQDVAGQNTAGQDIAARVVEALKGVIDPEIGINVVDLGLVYDVRVEEDSVAVDMTLTSPACPDADVLREQVYQALGDLGLEITICVTWVWKPAWGPQRITSDGREQLRALGFNV
ncbi:MAG: metal-sulfur cluster assembly factor [Micromonosporaceae bacterium]|nr:metal-sulfur cluster assembly factor [Micromonosporaceae bacterium]